MAVSVRDIFTYLVTRLETDPTLSGWGIEAFSLAAPEDHPCPFILMERQSGTHHYAMTGEALQKQWIFLKAVTTGEDGGKLARQIMDRVNVLLTGETPTIASGYVARIEATTDLEYVETDTGNVQFYHVGTVYQFFLGNN